MLDKAYATADARMVSISHKKEVYEPWKKTGYAGKLVVPLEATESVVAHELFDHKAGEIAFGLRSFLAQLGIDTVVREAKPVGNMLYMDALFLNMDGSRTASVLRAVRQQARAGLKPIVGRGVLLPYDSRLTKPEVEQAHAMEECDWDPRSIILESGKVAIPVLPLEYRFANSAYAAKALHKVLVKGASGREMLRQKRKDLPMPDMIKSGQFFVGGFSINLPGMVHAMLDREMVDADGNPIPPMHGAAGFLEAGRTDEDLGDRQVEVSNVNGHETDPRRMYVVASIHHASDAARPGV